MADNEPAVAAKQHNAELSPPKSTKEPPLYKRLGNMVIPPLQSSFSFLSPGGSSEGDEFPFESSDDSTPREDDDDKATGFGELKPLNQFFNMLTATLVQSGHGFLKQLRSGAALPDSGLHRTRSPLLAYGVYDYGSDTESDTADESLVKESEPQNDSKVTIVKDSSSELVPVLVAPRISTSESRSSCNEDLHSDTSADTFHDAALRRLGVMDSEKIAPMAEFETIQENSFDSDVTLDEADRKLSVFQQSILDNLDPQLIHEGVLIVHNEKKDHLIAENRESELYKRKVRDLRLKIADKLTLVFQLKENEYFCGNYNAWLAKDVLLQGHIYLTHKNLLFFSFLPKRYLHDSMTDDNGFQLVDDSDDIVQAGTLSMRNPNFTDQILSGPMAHRFWVILRLETLSVYSSAVDLYFPTVVIDLKDCMHAEIEDLKANRDLGITSPRGGFGRCSDTATPRSTYDSTGDDEPDISSFVPHDQKPEENPLTGGVWIRLQTKKRTYRFCADNQFSARKWVNNITKVAFMLQNSNARNEVLFKVPIQLIDRIEKNVLFDVANNSDTDEEPTISVTIIYTVNQKRLLTARMKERISKQSKGDDEQFSVNPNQRKIHLLFFQHGAKFLEAISNFMLADQDTTSDIQTMISRGSDRSLNLSLESESTVNRARNSTLKVLRGDSRSDHPISTLRDNDTNQLLEQLFVLATYGSTPTLTPTETNNEVSTIKKIGKSLASPSRLFGRSRSSSFADDKRPVLDEAGGLDGVWQLPRKLSVAGLKNINFSFEASQKQVSEAAARYNELTDAESPDEYVKTKSEVLSPRTAMPTPLNFGEASEYEQAMPKKLLGLKTFSKSIKAISGVSGIWSSNPTHYEKVDNDDPYYEKDASFREISNRNFLNHFSINVEKRLVASYTTHLQRSLPVYGKLYLGDSDLCFRSLLPGVSTKMILPLKDLENCYKEKGIKLKYSGLVLVIRGQDKLLLEFGSQKSRDDCEAMILRQLEILHGRENWRPEPHQWGPKYTPDEAQAPGPDWKRDMEMMRIRAKQARRRRINQARIQMFEEKLNAAIGMDVPLLLEDSPLVNTEVRPSTSFKFTLLTIGSRGDVQPYLALAKGLQEEGHDVTIATHSEFKDWVEGHNVKFREIAGNPTELMALMVRHGSMSMSFIKEASAKFRSFITDLLASSWDACQGTDILIESPSAMGGVHIAEALGIPYMRAFTMPWTRTRAYPHAFIVPDQKKGGSYNYLTHVMFETIFWKGISGQVNRWRQTELGLPRTSLLKLQQTKIPFLYNISPSIFPPSVDFPDWVKVTGYWFLNEGGSDFAPPPKLLEFLSLAKEKGKKVVYIGFGSIVVKNAKSLTKAIVEAVQEAGIYCILNKGWSDRLLDADDKAEKEKPEIDLPPEVFNSGTVPHDWLFSRIDAAVHHGGSGTTGATLRAGLPTIIKPFFGDQFFYASRVEQMGVGLSLKKLNSKSLTKALNTVTSDFKMIEKCRSVSERINHEDGVSAALEAIYSELEYAKHLSVSRRAQGYEASGLQTPVVYEQSDESEESGYDDEDESETETDGESTDNEDITEMGNVANFGYRNHRKSLECSSEEDVAIATTTTTTND